jgi:hypothetical protein
MRLDDAGIAVIAQLENALFFDGLADGWIHSIIAEER